MSLILPFPLMSGSFVPTGAATVDQFSPTTVHSDSIHNNPHAKLLANDVAIKNAVDEITNSSYKEIYWRQYVPTGVLFTAEPSFESISVPAGSFSTMFFVEINVGLYAPDQESATGVFIAPTHNVQKGAKIPNLSPLPAPIVQPFGFVGVYTNRIGTSGHFQALEFYVQRSFKHDDISTPHTFSLRAWPNDVNFLHEITVRVFGY